MDSIKHLIKLLSDKLVDYIQGIFVNIAIISFVELLNVWDVTNFTFIYFHITGFLDVVWILDFIFTIIAALNWVIRKIMGVYGY